MNEIESYQHRMLRNIININWFDYQSNKNKLAIANCPSKDTIINYKNANEMDRTSSKDE